MKASVFLGAIFVLAASSVSATAQAPKLVKQHKQWGVYSFTSQKGKVCYVLSQPREKSPADRNHGDVFFFVSTRPGDKVVAEPSVIVGYTFKPDSKVTVTIDGNNFSMFTQGEGAWIEKAGDEDKLINAMRAGSEMKVVGRSSRDTQTSYVYSLSGVTAALKESEQLCK